MTGPLCRSPRTRRISHATLTSSTGSAVSETRMVSPMPVGQQRADADRALDGAGEGRAGLGHAQMQRIGHLARRAAGRPRSSTGTDELLTEILKSRKSSRSSSRTSSSAASTSAPAGRRWRTGAGGRAASRSSRRCASGSRPPSPAHDLLDLVGAADVAGVDAHGGDARVDRPQRQRGVEVDVGDHRQRRAGDDRRQRVGVGPARHRHADDVAAGLGAAAGSARASPRRRASWSASSTGRRPAQPPPIGTPPTLICTLDAIAGQDTPSPDSVRRVFRMLDRRPSGARTRRAAPSA